MKKIFKIFLYRIQTRVCNHMNKLATKLDTLYTNTKFENEIATRKLVIELKQHVVKTHTVIDILENHIINLSKTK